MVVVLIRCTEATNRLTDQMMDTMIQGLRDASLPVVEVCA